MVEEEDEEQVTIQAFNPASIQGWRDEVEDATSPTRVVATVGTVAMAATGIIIPSSMATAVEVVDSERAMARTVAVEIGTLDDRVMDLITEVSSRSGAIRGLHGFHAGAAGAAVGAGHHPTGGAPGGQPQPTGVMPGGQPQSAGVVSGG